jgi:hypothetical protein
MIALLILATVAYSCGKAEAKKPIPPTGQTIVHNTYTAPGQATVYRVTFDGQECLVLSEPNGTVTGATSSLDCKW